MQSDRLVLSVSTGIALLACLSGSPADAATICRWENITGYDKNARRARLFVPKKVARSVDNITIYVERDWHGNPYYYTNYKTPISGGTQRYGHTTKIGGKTEPVTDVADALMYVLYDGTVEANYSTRRSAARKQLEKVEFLIERSILLRNGPAIDLSGLDSFTLVDARNKERRVFIKRERLEEQETGGGMTVCEAKFDCLPEEEQIPRRCRLDEVDLKIRQGATGMVCKNY